MKTKDRFGMASPCLLPVLLFTLLAALSSAGFANASEHPEAPGAIIQSGAEVDYPPFSIVDDAGRADGFSVELMRAALLAMGCGVDFQTGTWAHVRGMLARGEIQALPLVGRTPEREPLFDFTFPYISIHGAIVLRKDEERIRSLADLKGRTVAVMEGDTAEEFLRRGGDGIQIHTTPSFKDALRELDGGRHDAVVVQRLLALRLIQEMGLENLRVLNEPVEGFRQDFCFAVREGDRKTLALLNEGLALVIADGTYRHLHAKWFAAMELPSSRRIVVGGDHDYPPFEYLDENRRPVGYNVDLIRAIAKEMHLDIDIRLGPWSEIIRALEKGDIDVVHGMLYSEDRDLTFDFTPPHMVNHYVSVVRRGSGAPPADLAELKEKRLVVQQGDIMNDFVVKNGLAAQTSLVGSHEEAIRAVAEGRRDCALVARLTAMHWIQKNGWDNLVVGWRAILSPGYCIAVAKDHKALLSVFSEGLKMLEASGEYRRIQEKWLGVYKAPPPDLLSSLRKAALVVIPLLLLLLVFFLWSWSLRRQVALRTAALQEREEKYRLLADNTIDAIWIMNPDLEFTYINPACYSLTGYTPEEWIGSRLEDHCDAENFSKMKRGIHDILEKGPSASAFIFESEMIRKDRQPLPVEIHGKVVHDENGRLVGFQGVTRDISERREAEKVQVYQDQLLREMGAIAKVGAWEIDADVRKANWTEEITRILDLEPDREMDLAQVLDLFRGECRSRLTAAVRKAIAYGSTFNLELEISTARGEHKWVRMIGQPKLENGGVDHVRGTLQDITEQKHAKERIEHLNRVLRSIRNVNQLIVREQKPEALIHEACRIMVQNRGYASALILLTDSDGRVGHWAAEGNAASSESLKQRFENGKVPPCCDPNHAGAEHTMVVGKNIICSRCPIAHDLQETQSLCVGLVHQETLLGYLAVSLDSNMVADEEEQALLAEMSGDLAYALYAQQVDERRKTAEYKQKALEAQLIQAQRMESIGRLAGGIAHDFNNMLSVITGYTELAQEKTGPEDPRQKDFTEILKAADRSAEIIRRLLGFARRQPIAPKVLCLNETVEGMLNMLRRLIGEDIHLAWMPESSVWPTMIDPAQIDQIMANLCVNARDAIAGVGKITIETANTSLDEAYCAAHAGFVPGDYIMLAVSDNGCGMTPEVIEKVFEPFFSTKSQDKGTGLGLATVYGIVKQNKGFINIYSEPGQGTTIRIYLPRHMDRPPGASDNAADPVRKSRGETILVVEDEASILKLTRKILQGMGYTVFTANTPQQAIALAEGYAGRIHMVITDVVMPEMSGRDLADRLHSIDADIKFLFMSGYTANAIIHRGVLDEGIAFIQKPFTRKRLAAKVQEVLNAIAG